MVAAQLRVAVQHERDVAVGAAERRPAGAAVQRGRDAAPVEQQDRLRPALRDAAQLGEERRGQRIPRLAAKVDDAHRRELGADPAAEREPFERGPALRPRRRRAEDRGATFERSPLHRDRARVVARVGVLLVRLVVLLVDDDQPEAPQRREHRRTCADDDAGVAAHDPLALVAALGLAERGMEHCDAVAESRAEPPDRLRGERDLRHEHDRAEPALERRSACLQVHLGLAGAGRAVQQEVPAAGVDRRHDPLDGRELRRRSSGSGSVVGQFLP